MTVMELRNEINTLLKEENISFTERELKYLSKHIKEIKQALNCIDETEGI